MGNGRYAVLLERVRAAHRSRGGLVVRSQSSRFAEVLFVVREFAITYHAPITRIGARGEE
jgi:acyl-CoA thioester hydrolase